MSNKENILHTALRLFAEQGYDRTPTSQIAREAGVSEGLIFRHYGSKAGLGWKSISVLAAGLQFKGIAKLVVAALSFALFEQAVLG